MSGAIFYLNLLFINAIFHEEVPNVNVSGIASTQVSAIFLHSDGTLIILVKYVIQDAITLVIQKMQ